MKVDTSCNILMSFAYLSSSSLCQYVAQAVQDKRMNLMIDSGAFTKFNSKSGQHVTLDNYCSFLDVMGEYAEKYVMLDVIGNESASKRNYETMIERGHSPMFVATMYDNDFAYIEDTLKINPNICVAGGATTKGDWMSKRFQDVYLNTGSKARIHGLAYVTFPKCFQLPLASMDSSTWQTGAQKYGVCWLWDDGMKTLHYQDVCKKGKKIPSNFIREFNELGITPKMYADLNNHRGMTQMETFCCIVAYVKFQKYAKKNGRDLFLAVGSKQSLDNILWVHENFNHLRYEDWVKFVKNG